MNRTNLIIKVNQLELDNSSLKSKNFKHELEIAKLKQKNLDLFNMLKEKPKSKGDGLSELAKVMSSIM